MPQDEALLTEAIDILNSLSLHTVNQDWVDNVWDAQFTECEELPPDYEDSIAHLNLPNEFSRLAEISKKWIRLQNQGEVTRVNDTSLNSSNLSGTVNFYRKSFWDALIDQEIKYKVLIGLLYLFMERGQNEISEQRTRDLGIKSASLYFILLGIPGSGAFNIFHSVLYNKALDTFKLINSLNLAKKSPKKKGRRGGASQASGRGSQRGRGSQARASQRSRHSSGGSNDSDGEDDDVGPELTQREVIKLFDQLNSVLESLHILLDNCSLKRSSESLEATVASMVDLTLLETQFHDMVFDGSRAYRDLSGLAINGYIGLEKVSAQLHGGRTVLHVFKGLMPSILTVPRGASDMTARSLSNIRELALKFIKHLVRQDREDVVQKALLVLVQHLAVKVPDKTDYRKMAADAIVALMEEMSLELYRKTVKWFVIFCHTDKSTHRLFSLEVLGRLISSTPPHGDVSPEASTINPRRSSTPVEEMESETSGTPVVPPGTSTPVDPAPPGSPRAEAADAMAATLSPKYLFATIYGRCADVSASTRAQALKTLGEITADGGSITSDIIKDLLTDQRTGSRDKRPLSELLQDDEVDLEKIDPLPSSKEFIDFLRRRALDQSVFVRKSALQVLENVLKLSGSLMSGDLVKVLAEHCRDSSLAVRKQMVISLTELLKMYPHNDELLNIWVEGVFPLILDVEAKAAETVLDHIWEVLFHNMVSVDKVRTAEQNLPWAILDSVEKQKMVNYLSRACNTWSKEGKLTVKILSILQSYIGSTHNASAWMLLATVTQHVPCKDPRFVLEYFNESIQNPEDVGLYTLLQVLKVLFSSVARLSDDDRTTLQANLLHLVRQFRIPPDLIQVAVDVITVVSKLESKENLPHYQSAVDGWAVPIIGEIDAGLSELILRENNENNSPNQTRGQDSEAKMMRQIFTLGELAQICPLRINRRLFLLMQSIIFQKGEKVNKQTTQEDPYIPASQTQSSQPPTCVFVPSKKLQSLTIVTLGKMCLQNEEQAKKIIPAFGVILSTNSDSSIKNNIMYVLTDMCVRFASLVDPLLPAMTACLKDRSVSVRRTTLILLIHLLQEDFLKIRGNSHFFLRLLQTFQDPSEEIRGLTTFYIQQRLLKKLPNIMYSLFTETLFHLNEYKGHSKFDKVVVTEKERKMFCMTGEEHKEERRDLYKFMLNNMNDTHRFTTTHRLCQDVLNGVVEKNISLDGPGNELLKDTLYILASDEIKLASLKSRGGGEDEEGGDNLEAALIAATKKQIITQVVKKNTIENIIPIVIALKTKLTDEKSPLVKDVFNFLRKLMEDYKDEVNEILDANKQLAAEINYDIRMFEEAQEREREESERQKEREEEERARRAAMPPPEPELPGSPGLASVQKALIESARRGKGQTGRTAQEVLKNLLLKNAEAVGGSDAAGDVTAGTPAKALAATMEDDEERAKDSRREGRRKTIAGIVNLRQTESPRTGAQAESSSRSSDRRKSFAAAGERDRFKGRVKDLLNSNKKEKGKSRFLEDEENSAIAVSKKKEKGKSRFLEDEENSAIAVSKKKEKGTSRFLEDEENSDNLSIAVSKSSLSSDLDKDTPRNASEMERVKNRVRELLIKSKKGSPEKEKSKKAHIETSKGKDKREETTDDDNSSTSSNSNKKEKGKSRFLEDEENSDTLSIAVSKRSLSSDLDKDTPRNAKSKKTHIETSKGKDKTKETTDDNSSTSSNASKSTIDSDLDRDRSAAKSNPVGRKNTRRSTRISNVHKDTLETNTHSDHDTYENLQVQTDNETSESHSENNDLSKDTSKDKTVASLEVQTDGEASTGLSFEQSTNQSAASLEAQAGGEVTKNISLNSDLEDNSRSTIEDTASNMSEPDSVQPSENSDQSEPPSSEKRTKKEKQSKLKEDKLRVEEENQRKLEEEMQKQEEEVKRKEDEKRRKDEDKQRKAEEKQQKVEEEKQRKLEEKLRKEEEKQRKADEKQQKEEEEKCRLEEEQQRKEEEKRRLEEKQQRKEEEEKRQLEEEHRKEAEEKRRKEEEKRLEEEEKNRKMEEEKQKKDEVKRKKLEKEKKRKEEEEKTKKQVEIAKLRVKINEKKDELDNAVSARDFGAAQVIQGELDQMDAAAKVLQTQLTVVSEAATSTSAGDNVNKGEKDKKSTASTGKDKDADVSRRISGPGANVNGQEKKKAETSRRISGQGKENQADLGDNDNEEQNDPKISDEAAPNVQQQKTPIVSKAKRLHALRAISTPQLDHTVHQDHVTFLGESAHDISSISVLSEPSTILGGTVRRSEDNRRSEDKPGDDTDAVSFRFRHGNGRREMFDDLFDAAEKRNSAKGANRNSDGASKETDQSGESEKGKKRKTKTPRCSLERIAEDSQEAEEEEPKEKRRRASSVGDHEKKKKK